MSAAGEARSWFEGVQQILGMSIDRMFGMIAPAVLAGWFLSSMATPKDGGWPMTGPFQWLASVSKAAGIPDAWAIHASEWITARDAVYVPCLIGAAVLTGLANQQKRPAAFLGLAAIAYAIALELQNSPQTLGWYLATSSLFCVVAIVADASGRSYFSGYLSFPSLSLMKWLRSISIVAFSGFTLPFFIIVGAIEGYRIEQPVIPASPSGADIRALNQTSP